jgi:hypothetical protein
VVSGVFPGRTYLFRRMLPPDPWLSGHDAPNRVRQRDLDSTMIYPGRARELLFDRLERLEKLAPPSEPAS